MNILATWPALVAISVIAYSVSVILQKIVLRNDKSDPVAFAILSQCLAGLVMLVAAIIHGFALPDLARYWPNVLLMMVLYGAGNVFIFKALKTIEASTFTILFASRALWTIMGALLLLGESFTLARIAGTLLIIGSVVVVSWKKRQKLALGKGEVYSLLAAILFGSAFVNDAFIVQGSDVLSYTAVALLLTSLGVAIAQPRAIGKVRHLLKGSFLAKVLLLSALYGTSIILELLAYKIGRNAAQIAPLLQTATIATVILSIIFLNERTALARKSVGTLVSFIGVVLVG